MRETDTIGRRRFYRDKERGVLGGVCAGLADYFGFNLKVTRVLAVIALLMAFPATVIAYIGTVLLVPAAPRRNATPDYDVEFRQAVRSDPRHTMADVGRRYKKMEVRLARLERYVTSPRFDIDQEFRRL